MNSFHWRLSSFSVSRAKLSCRERFINHKNYAALSPIFRFVLIHFLHFLEMFTGFDFPDCNRFLFYIFITHNMDQAQLIAALRENHQKFTDYLAGLSTEDFTFAPENGWSAGQQLQHIVLCLKPLVHVYGMDAEQIIQNFGQTDRSNRSPETLKSDYLAALAKGGKAPQAYVPEPVADSERALLLASMTGLVEALCERVDRRSPTELDQLCILHPLMGLISLREMLYNATYHVTHHHNKAIAILAAR